MTPGGRLTLNASYPVPIGNADSNVLSYVVDQHNQMTVDGVDRAFPAATSLTLDPNPGDENAVLGGAVYDVFGLFDAGGNFFIGTTHAWWSLNDRTGGYYGYTDLARNADGLWTNKGGALGTGMRFRFGPNPGDVMSVSDGQALYLGSIYPYSNGNVRFVIRNGPSVFPGIMADIGLFNAYNRREMAGHMQLHVSALDWSVTGPTSGNGWRPAAGSTNFRVQWIDGLGDMTVRARYNANVTGHGFVGVALNSTTAPTGTISAAQTSGREVVTGADEAQALGVNYFQAMEAGEGPWDGWPTQDTLTTGADAQTGLEFALCN